MILTYCWRFRLKLLTLMTLYSVVLFFLFALVNNQQFYLSQVLLCFFALTIIIGIFVLSEKQLSIVEKFFQAASHDDFSQKYNANDVSGTLANALNMITEKFKQSRVSEQTENSFLKTIIRQAPVAIIVFDQRERLTLFNHTASKLFSVKAPMVLADLASGFYELPELLRTLVGNHKVLYKMHRDGVDYSFKFSASHLLLANKTQTLVIIENIGREINQAEYQAWRNLIGVLTHEMMNSITPIVSLADNCCDILAQPNLLILPAETLAQDLDDTKRALGIIVKRSQGIMDFVDGYRQLSKLPAPNLTIISLHDALSNIMQLQQQLLTDNSVALSIHVQPTNLTLLADLQHFEQMLINLINNACDACTKKNKGAIKVVALMRGGHTIVSVQDDGDGIDDKVLAHIFTPFFTTKRHGTGIGMTLTRQIMHAHGGQVSVKSQVGQGTLIELIF